MTSVRFCRDSRGRLCGFTVLGHTGYAPEGEDIVCAGVSALTQTAVNALETVAHAPASVIVRSGFFEREAPQGAERPAAVCGADYPAQRAAGA